VNADVVWVDVLPSMKHFLGNLRKGSVDAAGQVGRESGDAYSKGFQDKAVAGVENASAKVAAARAKEANASDAVKVAEQRLAEVRKVAEAGSARLLAAEAALERNRRAATLATESSERANRSLERANRALESASDGAGFSFARLAQSMTELNARSDALDRTSKGLASTIRTVGSIGAASFGVLAGQAGVGALVAVTGASLAASGALLLLPAAAAAVAAPVATAKLGLIGFDAALKGLADGKMDKVTEAMEDMAPAGRAVIQALVDAKPAFDDLRRSIQQEMFEGLSTEVRSLAGNYLPMLRGELGLFAAIINGAAREVLWFVNQARTVDDVRTILGNVRTGFAEVEHAAQPIVQILTDIAVVGSEFIPNLAGGLANLAQRTADWVRHARETGILHDIISQALSVVGQLGMILGNVGMIIVSVFRAGYDQGQGFLTTLVQLTTSVREFVSSAQGMAVLRAGFQGVGDAVGAITPLIGTAASIVLGQLLPAFSQFAVILAPIVHELLRALQDAFRQLAPLVPQLASTVGTLVGSFIPLIPLVTQLALILLPPLLSIITALGPAFPFLAIGIFAAVQAFQALNALVTFSKLAIELYESRMLLVRVATGLWTAAQWLLNAALTANPIGLVILALVALGAGLYMAWTHSETFRNIVTGAWNAVKDAAVGAWQNYIKPAIDAFAAAGIWLYQNALLPAFNGIMAAWNAVSTAVQWAWNNVIKPTWDFLVSAAMHLLAVLVTIVLAPILIAWNLLSAGIMAGWNNIIKPAWDQLQLYLTWLWETRIRPLFDLIKAGWDALGRFFVWVYDTILKPLWDGLVQYLTNFWNNRVRPLFDQIKAGWDLLGRFFTWVYDTILKPLWDGLVFYLQNFWNNRVRPIFDLIKSGWDALGRFFRWVYDNIIQPAWDAVARSLSWVKDRFQDAVNNIRNIWNGIKRVLAVPINFMINTVWNGGIVPAWNAVAALLPGVGKISPQKGIPEAAVGGQFTRDGVNNFRAGGQLQGRYRGPEADNLLGIVDNKHPIKVNPLEWIHPVRSVKKYGGDFMRSVQHGTFPEELAKAPRRYTATEKVRRADVREKYAQGGPVIPGFAQGSIVDLGRLLQSKGARVSEHPAFGGVAPVHGKNSLHYSAQAIDVNTRPGTSALEQRELDPLAALARSMGFRVIWRSAGHFNHMHADTGKGLGSIGTASGSATVTQSTIEEIFNSLKKSIADTFVAPARAAVNKLTWNEPPAFHGIPRKAGHFLIDKAVEMLTGKAQEKANADGAASAAGSSLGVATTNGPVQETVRAVAATRGWGSGPQWDALDWIVRKESGWRPTAQNPVSSASGLFQMIDGTWRAYRPPQASSFAKARLAPVNHQAVAGMNYFGGRYGSPVGARAFWQKNGWYAQGGQVPAFARGGHTRGWAREGMAMLHPDERVLAPEQDRYFRQFVDATSAIGGAGGDRMLAREINIHANTTDQGRDVVDNLWHKVRVADRGGVYTFTT
jgi:phage-related protein